MRTCGIIGVFILIIFTLQSCIKDNVSTVRVYLDIPFFATPKSQFFIIDTVQYQDGSIKVNRVLLNAFDYADNRAFGIGCSMSTGGSILITSSHVTNNGNEQSCGQYFPGCSPAENEYDPYLNYNAPRCKMEDSLELCLLNVFPSDPKAAYTTAYNFKYVFKRSL